MFKEKYVFTVYFNKFIVAQTDNVVCGVYYFGRHIAWDERSWRAVPCKSSEEFKAHFCPPPKLNVPYYLLPGHHPARAIAQRMLDDNIYQRPKNGCFTLFFPSEISSTDRIYKEIWEVLSEELVSRQMKPTLKGLCVQVVPA